MNTGNWIPITGIGRKHPENGQLVWVTNKNNAVFFGRYYEEKQCWKILDINCLYGDDMVLAWKPFVYPMPYGCEVVNL